MPNNEYDVQCKNPGCQVSKTGKCLEGLELDKCPHFLEAIATTESVESEAEAEVIENDLASTQIDRLPTGDRLISQQVSSLLRSNDSHIAAIIGPTAAGKTSLVASIYDLFQKGPVGNLQFACSNTLFAFEQACHHARAVSQRDVPDMAHTPLSSGVGFYHLGLQDSTKMSFFNLLLTDRSGEDYRSAADDPSNATEFIEVQRADSIAVLVDGDRLCDIGERHNVRSEIEMILQGLVDGDAVHSCQKMAVVLTKLDEIRRAEESDKKKTEQFYETIIYNINRLFGNIFKQIVSLQVAASPKTDILPRGFQVSELLDFWMSPSPVDSLQNAKPLKSLRAIGRLTIKE